LFLDDAEALHTIERGSFSILKLSCSAMDGGLSGNLSSLVLKRGYLPEFDPKIQHSLILEEIVIMGLDAHALQGRSISALMNGQAMAPFSIYFDPFVSTLHFTFGDNVKDLRQSKQSAEETHQSSEAFVVPAPSVICLYLLLVAANDCATATVLSYYLQQSSFLSNAIILSSRACF